MRALKMLPLVFVLVLVGCNTDRFSRNSGIRRLSAGIVVNNPDWMDEVLDDAVIQIKSALQVVPGIVMEGPGGQLRLARGATESSIGEAIMAVAHLPGERPVWRTEFYWFKMEKTCDLCPLGWRWLGVNIEPFSDP